MRKRTIVVVAVVLACITGTLAGVYWYLLYAETKTKRTKVVIQFGWLPDAHHSGFWIAKEKGFYRDEGCDVELLSGGLDSSPIKTVLSGAADIGQVGGIEQLIMARSEGLPIKAIAAYHRDTPHALISLDRNPIRTAKDIPGKRIAVAYGDAAEILLKAYLERSGVSEEQVAFVPFRFDITPLMHGNVDAITGFSTDQPATLRSKGLSPVVLKYADAGIHSYGYTLFCSEHTLDADPKTIQAFLRASRKGWEYAFAHPDEAVEVMIRAFPSLNAEIEHDKLELVQRLMCDDKGRLCSWKLDATVVHEAGACLKAYGKLATMPHFEDITTDDARVNSKQ